ncbi:ATP-binding protein [Solirubrobacter ginsenosidimutans]|uniref:ATP-binding protein n=1 Tax=Solirubrobacter ginsenosidimutans TaxID=490573 RepID=A0A9X3MYI2_9ACTN|nr:ATP-binding protein [Solirubrobacter ginsenosidimutans]MDA0165174.1 ATP-binding protein [Solirubrobacter ginsenosidimutans]
MRLPEPLRSRLEGWPHASRVLRLVEAAGPILVDNKTPFFPAYTDHGIEHVVRVMETAWRLVPEEAEPLLNASDAAVLAGAAVVHDLGMHLRPPGFAELVAPGSRFKSLRWFREAQGSRAPDRPWDETWQAFRKAARHLTETQIDTILGPGNRGIPAVAFGDNDLDHSRWTHDDHLLIGEFIRRHHARLSHEIAIYGFPGVPPGDFPVLARDLPGLADAIGVTARSHNEDLRVMLHYLKDQYRTVIEPAGAHLPYLMGLLGVADYLQIDQDRAPTVLLRLKEPQSRVSVEQWALHRAVHQISWAYEDPGAIVIDVLPSHDYRTHFQLRDLFRGLRAQLDVTTAVLSETYGTVQPALRLTKQRVETNLDSEGLHEALEFIPRRAALRSGEELFRLMIGDLYGDHPAVAGRELLQNAVDAVRERRRWEHGSDRAFTPDEFRPLPADVLVEHVRTSEGEWILRIVDRGIGMTPDTIVDYFLKSGASLGPSPVELDGIDRATAIRWMKTGRFGIGAFASFLLGPEIRVTTRHLTAERGARFVARLDDDIVELIWADDVPFGTEVVIPTADPPSRKAAFPPPSLIDEIRGFYRLGDPDVFFRDEEQSSLASDSRAAVPDLESPLPKDWRLLAVPELDGVLWHVSDTRQAGSVAHNGIGIHVPGQRADSAYEWRGLHRSRWLRFPPLAVFDSRHRLGISLNRYRLTESFAPFQDELLRSIGLDVVAHALVAGARQYPLASGPYLASVMGRDAWAPLTLCAPLGDGAWCVWWQHDDLGSVFASHRFLNDVTSPSWQRLPMRSVLGLEHDRLSISAGVVRELVRRGIGEVERISPFKATITMIAFAFAQPRHELLSERPDLSFPLLGEHLTSAPGGEWGYSVDPGQHEETPEPTRSDDTALLRELLEVEFNGGATSAAVTLFRPGTGSPVVDALAATWQRIVGGTIERDPERRREQRDAIAERHPEIRPHLAAWSATRT